MLFRDTEIFPGALMRLILLMEISVVETIFQML